jgi:hypothetical protein
MNIITRPKQTLSRPLYTLHSSTNSVMAWPIKEAKMSVMAFYNRNELYRFANLVESHYEQMKEWPDFSNLEFIANPKRNSQLNYLDIHKWSDLDSLRVFCAEKYLDLVTVNRITNDFNISGDVLHISIPENFHVEYLEELLNRCETGTGDDCL